MSKYIESLEKLVEQYETELQHFDSLLDTILQKIDNLSQSLEVSDKAIIAKFVELGNVIKRSKSPVTATQIAQQFEDTYKAQDFCSKTISIASDVANLSVIKDSSRAKKDLVNEQKELIRLGLDMDTKIPVDLQPNYPSFIK